MFESNVYEHFEFQKSEKMNRRLLRRPVFLMGKRNRNVHVAIVGTGPAGFYAAKYLLEKHNELRVDLIEKQPVSFVPHNFQCFLLNELI